MSERRAAEKAKKDANNLQRLEDMRIIRKSETNLAEVVKLFHHLP